MVVAMRLAALVWLIGCSAIEPSPAPLIEPSGERLVAVGSPQAGPAGSDSVPAVAVAFQFSDGSRRPVDRRAIAFVPRWRRGAALIDPERRLYEVLPNGERRMLVAGAGGELAISPDGRLLVYAVERGELRTHDGESERTIASGLSSAGVLRVLDRHVAFVGARPGGVAGVWIAAIDGSGARCLTNCALRTGEPWLDQFVAPPSSAGAFRLENGVLGWIDRDGVRREASIAAVTR
jgi:hypothetical protein